MDELPAMSMSAGNIEAPLATRRSAEMEPSSNGASAPMITAPVTLMSENPPRLDHETQKWWQRRQANLLDRRVSSSWMG
jgi:hypothetical protein